MSSAPIQQAEQPRPTAGEWLLAVGKWLLAIGPTLASSAAGGWVWFPYLVDSPGLWWFMVVTSVAILLGGAVLRSNWALLLLPLAVLVGMAVPAIAWAWGPSWWQPHRLSLLFVLYSWLAVELVPAIASAAIGVGVGRMIAARMQQEPRPGTVSAG